jgi:DNA-binding CsgD family transcriptional regulator
LVVLGEAGVGKTALIRAASEAAARSDTRVLSGGGAEFETDMTFSTLHQVLGPLRSMFNQLNPSHRDALAVGLGLADGSVPELRVVAAAALALLRTAAADRPVLVVVDDLPWVDRASAKVFGFVARRLDGIRIGLLSAARSGEDSLFDRAGLPVLDVLPLEYQAAAALIGEKFPALASRSRRSVLETAGGNPLALLEFGAAASRSQEGARPTPGPLLPQTRQLQRLFTTQIQQLPVSAQQLVLVLALDGTGDLRLLQRVDLTGLFRENLDAALRVRLVYVDDDAERVGFRHPLIRGAAVELASEEERRRAHLALATAFADEPDRLAWHLAEASGEADENVAAKLEQAGYRSLRRGDAVGAVAALTRAARLSPEPMERGRRLARAAYIGADAVGDLHKVAALLGDGKRTDVKPNASPEMVTAAAFLLLMGDGDIDTAHSLLVEAIEHGAETDSMADDSLEEVLHTLERVCYFGGRAELWPPLERALERLGPHAPLTVDLRAKTQGDPVARADDALPRLDEAIRALANERDPTRILRISAASAFVDRLPECRAALWRMVRGKRYRGAVSTRIGGLTLLGLDGYWTGQWDKADEVSREAAELSDTFGYALIAPWPRYTQALIAAARGDEEHVKSLTDLMLAWAAPRRMRSVQLVAWHARALAALGRGDFDGAYIHASRVTPAGMLAPYNPHVLWSALDLVEAAARTGRNRDAGAHVRAMEEAEVARLSSRLALVVRGSAAIAAPDAAAIDLFEEALALPNIDQWPFDLARIQLAFGERLRRIQAPRQSRPHLAAALETFERLGAKPWSDRAANELRASGQPASTDRTPHKEPLTPQERGIAELAATGLTNKQIGQQLFLSHRTVGGHLQRIFTKLSITSRAALRDALASLPGHHENER